MACIFEIFLWKTHAILHESSHTFRNMPIMPYKCCLVRRLASFWNSLVCKSSVWTHIQFHGLRANSIYTRVSHTATVAVLLNCVLLIFGDPFPRGGRKSIFMLGCSFDAFRCHKKMLNMVEVRCEDVTHGLWIITAGCPVFLLSS